MTSTDRGRPEKAMQKTLEMMTLVGERLEERLGIADR